VNGRGLLAAGGALAVLAGVAVVVEPGLMALIGLRTDRLVVTVLALLALLQGLLAVTGRLTGERRAAALPEVERRFRAEVPGGAFDDRLEALPALQVKRRDEERAAVRERLSALAVAVLVRRGLDEATARCHLETGTWTDDERAASFFVPAADRELSFGARMRDAFGSDLAFGRRARHAAAAIVAHAEREVPPPDAAGPGSSTSGTGAGGQPTGDTTRAGVGEHDAATAAADGGGDGE
jgi:hypothetical protein